MPDYEALLKAFQRSIGREVPQIEGSISRELPGLNVPALINSEPQVLGAATSSPKLAQLPIQEADTLSPSLNGLVEPISPDQDKLNKLKAAMATLGVGAGASLAMAGGGGNAGDSSENPAMKPTMPSMNPAATKAIPDSTANSSSDTEQDSDPVGNMLKNQLAANNRPFYSQKTPVAPKDIDFGTAQSLGNAQGLRDAQNAGNMASLINQAARGAAATASAMGGVSDKFDKTLADQEQFGKEIPQQYMQRVAMEKEDPNSAVSQGYKQIAKAMGFNITGNATATDIEKQFPQFARIYDAQNQAAARQDMFEESRRDKSANLAAQMAYHQEQKNMAKDQKQALVDQKWFDDKDKLLDASLARGTTGIGQDYKTVQNVERVQSLINGHANLNDINPQELAEVVKGLDRTITGGVGTEQGYEHLDPATLRARAANFMQQLTNQSQGAGASNFITRINQNLQVQKDAANARLADSASKLMAGSDKVAARNPEQFQNFLIQKGLPTDILKSQQKSGNNGPSTQGSHAPAATLQPIVSNSQPAVDPDATKYASMHNIPIEQASAIIKSRKAQMGIQ